MATFAIVQQSVYSSCLLSPPLNFSIVSLNADQQGVHGCCGCCGLVVLSTIANTRQQFMPLRHRCARLPQVVIALTHLPLMFSYTLAVPQGRDFSGASSTAGHGHQHRRARPVPSAHGREEPVPPTDARESSRGPQQVSPDMPLARPPVPGSLGPWRECASAHTLTHHPQTRSYQGARTRSCLS